jgi:predicted nucleic acid-binding protein
VSTDLFVDTSVLLTAVGGRHPARSSCQALVASVDHIGTRLHISAETVQEFLYHRMRMGSHTDALEEVRAVRSAVVAHALDDAVIDAALRLVEQGPVRGRDAMIAATAMVHGFDAIVTLDRDFDAIPGLRRLEPSEAARALGR